MKKDKNLISLAKESIFSRYPNVISIDVDMVRLKNNYFRTKMILKTKAKIYFTSKDGLNYKESLHKSCHAIKKQLERFKVNRLHSSRKGAEFEDQIESRLDA